MGEAIRAIVLPKRMNRIQTMTVGVVLPASRRDLRLDLFRGLANWAIFLGHIPDTALAWFTTRNYGFSDGANLFVFISGYTATLVFGRMMLKRGFLIGATRLFKRAWQLYVAHVLLFVFYLTSVHYLAHTFNIPHLMNQFNVAGLMDYPVETLTQGLFLKLKPLNLDILPLYIVLMGVFGPVLWLMLRYKNSVMLGSALLYLAARHSGWNFPSYPSGVWYFNPFTWQLLFVLGAWLALGRAAAFDFLIRSRFVFCLSIVFLLFALVMTLSAQVTALQTVFPTDLFEAFNPNDKTNLAPYRVAHLAVLVLLAVRLIPIDWPGLDWPIFRPLIKCGQQSLEVFCVGVFLSLIAHFVLEISSGGIFAQLLVGIAGLAIMTGVAYYRSWSKQVDKPVTAYTTQIAD
jgi:hypothetical protein